MGCGWRVRYSDVLARMCLYAGSSLHMSGGVWWDRVFIRAGMGAWLDVITVLVFSICKDDVLLVKKGRIVCCRIG